MFTHYRTKGIVLKKENLSGANQSFTIYTKDFGKLVVLGKGIRKIKSKLRGSLDLFYLSEVEFVQGKTNNILTDATLVNKFENLNKDLRKLAVAYKIAELTDSLIKGQEYDERIWQLLGDAFNGLDNAQLQNGNYQAPYYDFFWDFVSALGYQPKDKVGHDEYLSYVLEQIN